MNYYQTLIKNVPQVLTYQSEQKILPGTIIKTKLGNRSVNGLILKKIKKPEYDCVDIQEVLLESAVTPLQIELCQWMSSYYFASLQRCLQLFLPTVIWNQKMQPKYDERGELLNPDKDHHSVPHHEQPLTREQKKVIDQLLSQFNRKQRSLKNPKSEIRNSKITCNLLHGITGSGKTEIYLQLINKCIHNDQQSILLVPEIALTTELIQHFADHFPGQISIIHSKLTDRQRVQAWHRIHSGKTKLILGSRSALFTPWKDLGCIIVDEEHEWTYKQESSPRYHVKKVAEKIVELAKEKPTLLLGSATPSIETFYESKNPLTLTQRATAFKLPPVEIVDMRDEYKKKNMSMFSDKLQEAIQQRLDKKEQVILFLNKRGSSSSITCRDCGFTPKCPHCDISLTYHAKLKNFQEGGLLCHYCGSFQKNLSNCPDCKSVAIKHLGTGTQKAETQLQELFPKAQILRADKDTTSGRHDFEEIYHQMRKGKADILLGTQMIAKGLDLPKVTLTGIIIADIGLHIPDFRASERVFQLLMQVAGRSGRHQEGEVIIQTYQPEHPAIQAAKDHNYHGFYEGELKVREQNFYSPFSESIKLIFAHQDARKASSEAHKLYEEISKLLPSDRSDRSDRSAPSIGLSPNYIPRLYNKYHWNISLRGHNLRKFLSKITIPTGWKVDVDPR